MMEPNKKTDGHNNSISNLIEFISLTKLSELEHEIEVDDLVALTFLLYDKVFVATERLSLLLHRTSSTHNAISILHDWATTANAGHQWRYELLEALAICQMNFHIRFHLGFSIEEVKEHFLPERQNVSHYVHPMKKLLYKIFENLSEEHYNKILTNIKCDSSDILDDQRHCEIFFLKLMQKNVINIGFWCLTKIELTFSDNLLCNVNYLIDIFKEINLHEHANLLKDTQKYINKEVLSKCNKVRKMDSDASNFVQLFNEIVTVDTGHKRLIDTGAEYKIYNENEVGICLIINQKIFKKRHETFTEEFISLDDRLGTDVDKEKLTKTFKKLGFEVIVRENIDSIKILPLIHETISRYVCKTHSAFVLCVMSHGTNGHICGVDSGQVKIDDIENELYGERAPLLIGKPKILVIQACQGNTFVSVKPSKIYEDGNSDSVTSAPLKSDLLTYCATIPGHVAIRDELSGTIFIQALCHYLNRSAGKDSILDIFTNVNKCITSLRLQDTNAERRTQVPRFSSSLTKKLYLRPVT